MLTTEQEFYRGCSEIEGLKRGCNLQMDYVIALK
ncbi:hypothetical protein SCA_2457 [Staphylococcus carnosus subsp. carnosus TM300]|uniref:Uncharacterized protein n=1 Tax=Staphylococcus carnosus (strain TM300) TaxID=396513 RepID=B9DPX9_STACT|nr:hypothetical protein SCA_2457 [Staphylococcus carnosus subsp. carnosus TM300]